MRSLTKLTIQSTINSRFILWQKKKKYLRNLAVYKAKCHHLYTQYTFTTQRIFILSLGFLVFIVFVIYNFGWSLSIYSSPCKTRNKFWIRKKMIKHGFLTPLFFKYWHEKLAFHASHCIPLFKIKTVIDMFVLSVLGIQKQFYMYLNEAK